MPLDYIHTNSHKFKTQCSKYLKMLQDGQAKGIIIERYKKPIAVVFPAKMQELEK